MQQEITHTFGNRLRVRVCGILIENETILLVNHYGIGKRNDFWSPPGGGIDFGESLTDALIREFREETGLEIRVGRFLFVNEFISAPLHAVELFFEVFRQGGTLTKGVEPELTGAFLQAVEFVSWAALNELANEQKHNAFHQCRSLDDVLRLSGHLQSVR